MRCDDTFLTGSFKMSLCNAFPFQTQHQWSSSIFQRTSRRAGIHGGRKLGPTTRILKSSQSKEFRTHASSEPAENLVAGTQTAEDCINYGLNLYKEGKVNAALTSFNKAMTLNPTEEEAQAALYNKACCYAYKENGKEAQAALREALGKYNLRFSVILSDPDMAPFRALPEFSQLQTEAREGGEEIGSSFRRDLKLISEVRSPFRGVRNFIYIGLGMAAGIATIFTVPQLIRALSGGESAPELLPTFINLAINVGGGVILAALFLWDRKKEEEEMAKLQRDETLSRLPVRLSTNRVVELSQLREVARPVILVGDKVSIEKSMKRAEAYRSDLLTRGIIILPLASTAEDNGKQAAKSVKKGFGEIKKEEIKAEIGSPAEATGKTVDEFEERARELSTKRVSKMDNKFKAEIVSPGEWRQWVKEVKQSEGVKSNESVYLLLRLDGRLRRSGKGMPDWAKFVEEVPPLDSLVSKLER